MTLKELKQIPHLRDEIELYRERISALKSAEHNAEAQRLQIQMNKRERELKRLTEYIESIPDSGIRKIIKLKCEDGLSWVQISFKVKGYSADNARMTIKRYLEKS